MPGQPVPTAGPWTHSPLRSRWPKWSAAARPRRRGATTTRATVRTDTSFWLASLQYFLISFSMCSPSTRVSDGFWLIFSRDLVLIVLSVFRVRRSWRDHDDILVLILRVPAEEAATLRRLGPVQAQRSKGWGELRRHRHWRRPADAAARQHEGAVWDDDALGDISCYDLSFVTLFLADPSSAAGSAESSSQPAAVLDRGAAEPAEDRGAGRRRGRAARPNGRWGGGGGRAPPRFSQAAPAKEEERRRPAGGIPDEDRSQGCAEGAWHGAEGRRDAVPAEPGSGYEETDSRETVMGPNQDAAVSARGRVWRHKVPVSPRTFWWKLIQRGRTESSL